MIPYGGWTVFEDEATALDYCQGGHVGFSYSHEVLGLPLCTRCGRLLDLSPCGCGQEGHDHVGRSYCPTRMAQDRRALRLNAWHVSRMLGVDIPCTSRILGGSLLPRIPGQVPQGF